MDGGLRHSQGPVAYTTRMLRIIDLPGPARLAVAAFAVVLGGFSLLAQANLWVQDGGGSLPGPEQVLHKYNGVPNSSRLETVLSADLPEDHALAMWPYLGATDEEIEAARNRIVAWIAAGAPEGAFPEHQPLFAGVETCGSCHGPGGEKEDVPLETYAQVLPFAKPDPGMSWKALMISAHNHAYGFAMLAFVLSLLLCMSRLPRLLACLLILGLFVGPVMDIGGWFMTKLHGAPWHMVVILGGGLFGTCVMLALAVLLADALRLFTKGQTAA